MTTGSNRILDEFAKLMTDAAGAAQEYAGRSRQCFVPKAKKC